jgi:predicted Rossmann-fold nucleotide-binding protein
VKVNDDAISRNVPDAQVEIIKIHGCILNSPRNELVVTKADYEDFFINRPATAGRLKMDLVNKSFLFIGYGYGDPNIQNIILEARRLSNNATKQHYMVMMDERDAEFNLWCKDLKRYGINVVKIDDFLELEEILSDLSLKSRGNSVFITGSHNVKADADAFELGKKLANLKDIIFLDGQSTGIMRSAANAFMEKSIELKTEISKRLKIFPNPYAANSAFGNDLSFLPMLKQWRILLFKCAHVVVVFDGGMGTKAEVEVARYLGCLIIPFSKERNGLVNELMTYPDIIEKLNLISPHYVEKFNKDILIIEDVYETIVKAFKK